MAKKKKKSESKQEPVSILSDAKKALVGIKPIGELKKLKKKLPFKMLPGSWGLAGKTLERARIEYEYSGYALEVLLAQHDYTGEVLERMILDLNYEYKKITEEQYKKELLTLESKDDVDYQLKMLDYSREYEVDMSDLEYTKARANILKEPWVDVVKLEIDPKNPQGGGAFELDWNIYFIQELKRNGYSAPTEELMIQEWFDTLCQTIATEGGFINELTPDDIEESYIKVNPSDDGKIDYS